jgi:hypothetical protein
LYITSYRNIVDGKYYTPVFVCSENLIFPVDFLIDTGASKTQISWNDAILRININSLPSENQFFDGIGGSVKEYLLRQTTLVFKSNLGRYNLPIDNLSVMDYQTIDNRPCPISASMLGIDILTRFDILFRDNYAFLYEKASLKSSTES